MSALEIRAEALFVSTLQPSEHPNDDAVHAAVAAIVRLHGLTGLAALAAEEYFAHPDTSVTRMCWCRTLAGEAYPRRAVDCDCDEPAVAA
jgi:hypothetical protein